MRTQVMNDPNASAPWFEFYQVGGSRPIKQEISQFPFVIGRDDSADFTVESSRVSRKHVMLERQNGNYVLRDLESTNGTYVNGKHVSEVALSDGDVIVVADFELTFFSGNLVSRATATQVMTQPVEGRLTSASDLILQVRRLHETLTHRSVANRFQPVVRLETGDIHGYEAMCELDALPGANRLAEVMVKKIECHLTERMNLQHRLFAVEQAGLLEESMHLFLRLQVSEVNADFLPESLDRLRDAVDGRHRLVAEIPETAVCDIPYFRQFVTDLRKREIQVCYGGFCGGAGQISDWVAFAPDYLKLAPALSKGVSRASGGGRMLKALLSVTKDLECEVIAVGIDDMADADCLREIGCQYAQGDHFGAPASIHSFIGAAATLAPAGR